MIDYLAGMTDRFAIRAWTERFVPAGPAASDGALHGTTRASACATRSTSPSSSGARTELRKARRSGGCTGLCPFHDERTPSFGIDPVEKLYHCFGCGEGGDVFKFVMETEGLDFAVGAGVAGRALRGRARARGRGSARRPRGASARERLLALLERTAAYYVRVLWESPEAADAREYLARRAGSTEGALRAVPRRLLAVGAGTAC